jgi:hypothetical protein
MQDKDCTDESINELEDIEMRKWRVEDSAEL